MIADTLGQIKPFMSFCDDSREGSQSVLSRVFCRGRR